MRHIVLAFLMAVAGCAVGASDDNFTETAWQEVAVRPNAEQTKLLISAHEAADALAAGDESLRSEAPIDLTGQLVPIGGGQFDPETNFCRDYGDGVYRCCTVSGNTTCCCDLWYCHCKSDPIPLPKVADQDDQDDQVVLVESTGQSIAEQDLSHAFDPAPQTIKQCGYAVCTAMSSWICDSFCPGGGFCYLGRDSWAGKCMSLTDEP